MNEVLLTNIFFTITAIAIVLVTGGVLFLLAYLILIVRDVREIVGKLRKAGEEVEKDFESLRANLRREGIKGKAIVDAALGFALRKFSPRSRARKKEKVVEQETDL